MSHLSTTFIEEMKQRLLAEKELLVKELAALADRTPEGNYLPKVPDYGRDEESNATEAGDLEALQSTIQANVARLENVEAALGRMAAGTYGRTTEGTAIPEERLRANPAAEGLA